ncbi:hypothetical protein GIB67_028728 [Kingdonia uniflora]|uniref:Uncharacterized protein n=1 Tax=Kingdonia uniflora TaxID=39325 RepID=A0A7J7NAF8_9MAGN|nr:hypothetical protein GIB67_028728 [Kingdonia uniflora]
MATSGSSYDDIMEIIACAAGTSSIQPRRPRGKKTLPLPEQTSLAQMTQAETEVDAALSVAWKSVAEVLKVVAADHAEYEAEKASLAEQLKKRTALSHLRGKVIEMEKALSRARDSINRTQQDKQFVDESDKLECQRSLLSLTLYFKAEVDSERGLKEAYLELLTERGIVPDPARVKFLAQEARNRHSIKAQRCSSRDGVSIIWGGVGLLPDDLDFCRGKGQ